MRLPRPDRNLTAASLQRSFVTPEGVDLRLELGSAGTRAAAFLIDAVAMLVILVAATVIIFVLFFSIHAPALAIVWMIGFFVLRNGWVHVVRDGWPGCHAGETPDGTARGRARRAPD